MQLPEAVHDSSQNTLGIPYLSEKLVREKVKECLTHHIEGLVLRELGNLGKVEKAKDAISRDTRAPSSEQVVRSYCPIWRSGSSSGFPVLEAGVEANDIPDDSRFQQTEVSTLLGQEQRPDFRMDAKWYSIVRFGNADGNSCDVVGQMKDVAHQRSSEGLAIFIPDTLVPSSGFGRIEYGANDQASKTDDAGKKGLPVSEGGSAAIDAGSVFDDRPSDEGEGNQCCHHDLYQHPPSDPEPFGSPYALPCQLTPYGIRIFATCPALLAHSHPPLAPSFLLSTSPGKR
jgi:hypothetical protein